MAQTGAGQGNAKTDEEPDRQGYDHETEKDPTDDLDDLRSFNILVICFLLADAHAPHVAFEAATGAPVDGESAIVTVDVPANSAGREGR